MKGDNFNYEGVAKIEFSDKLKTFFQFQDLEKAKEGLIQIKPDEMANLLFSFEMERDGLNVTSSIKNVDVKEWKEQSIQLKFYFEDPEQVSSGYDLDVIKT